MSQEILSSDQTFTATTWYRVLYADTDNMKIVNNGHYFRYFEQGRGEYLRQLKMPYSEIEKRGYYTPLTEAWAHFYASFHYDELIRIECWVSLIKKASFRFDYRLYHEDSQELRVAGHTVHATLNHNLKVVKIPDWLLEYISPGSKVNPKNTDRL
ncbi:MAG: acyl-CoA thioesterase [Deltaproteobacteria bacterium]|jgi:acyl-CoA thioester hydrolase|nr:acyl-CoA thioesterase [Deltaproteobacteria bacterium]